MGMKRILVANRGEVVSRVARTAHARGIEVVGVYARSDEGARYLDDVDLAVPLGDDAARSPYLDAEAIVRAAQLAGADAVHPGYGFLAENAEFAERVVSAGLTWIGPAPETITAMGGKIRAKEIAREVGVPVLESVTVTDDVAEAVAAIRDVLVPPLLAKPSAGGGGKGMHRIDSLEGIGGVLAGARREAQSSFGDDTLFVERLLAGARHIEVQVFGDTHGNVVHLGTRDCSLQRRHQKIVEEAPAPALSDAVVRRLCDSATDLARRIAYVGAGTVEFLVLGDEVAFLEMNTRLQVEHPVTEEVTKIDLVSLQIDVADGLPLPLTQDDVRLTGHAIEVRLYAEDPAADYLPSPGLVSLLETPQTPKVRWELGVDQGSVVSSRYDPMIAKVVAYDATRDAAARRLRGALAQTRVGAITTNRQQLVAILSDPDFLVADLGTEFLDERPQLQRSAPDAATTRVCAIALALHLVQANRQLATVQRFAPAGWRNLRSQSAVKELVGRNGTTYVVGYVPTSTDTWEVTLDGVTDAVRVLRAGETMDLEVSGLRHKVRIIPAPEGYIVSSPLGEDVLDLREELDGRVGSGEGAMVAPLPAIVTQVAVEVGDAVEAGQTLVVIEAMKMEHRIRASRDGVVAALAVTPGQQIGYQDVVAELAEVAL
jgi:propionyl-CoA carboxylase alpha chain